MQTYHYILRQTKIHCSLIIIHISEYKHKNIKYQILDMYLILPYFIIL